MIHHCRDFIKAWLMPAIGITGSNPRVLPNVSADHSALRMYVPGVQLSSACLMREGVRHFYLRSVRAATRFLCRRRFASNQVGHRADKYREVGFSRVSGPSTLARFTGLNRT